MIVATAGHIDHGKTALVRALSGRDTDRLPEEKKRGISIEVGIAYWAAPGGRVVGFIDVPGHERFIRNMLSGFYAVDHMLLVVAADDGVMPQTREHLQIAALLGMEAGTVVITKADKADPARIAAVEREVAALLAANGMAEVPSIAVSAVTGQGVEELRGRLAALAAGFRPRGRLDERARFVIDRSFVVRGTGTVVIGTVIAGRIAVGETLTVLPDGAPVRVRGLEKSGQGAESAVAGERCAINLPGIDHGAVGRGSWLAAAEAAHVTERLSVKVEVLDTAGEALRHWTPLHVHVGAADLTGRIVMRRGVSIPPGGAGWAELRLQRPVHALHGDRFVLRDQSASRTVAGGRVLNPFPASRQRWDRAEVLAALDTSGPAEALARLVEARPDDALSLDWLARIFNRPGAEIRRDTPPDALAVGAQAEWLFPAPAVARLQARVTRALGDFHHAHPRLAGMELARLRAEVAPRLEPAAFAALLRDRAAGWGLALDASQARLRGHDPTANPEDARIWDQVQDRLDELAFALPSARELSVALGVPLDRMRTLLHRKAASGDLVKVTSERFALPEIYEALRESAAGLARDCPGGEFTAAQYRDRIGTGRTLAIEILECMDRLGVTLRRGNLRVMRSGA